MIIFLWALIGVVVLILMTLGDSITDKRHSATNYPRWHKRFRKFKPLWLWRKLQNRWHVWKQLRYFVPAGYIWATVVYLVWVSVGFWVALGFGACLVVGVAYLWDVIEPPLWWD